MNKNLLFLCALILAGCKNVTTTQETHTPIDSAEFITKTYESRNGVIPDEERQTITKKGGSPVYGEILHASLKTLLDDLQIKNNDVFYDLGSGTGKVTLQAYIDYPFKKAVGIELSPTRCSHAIDAKETLASQHGIDKDKTLDFINGDVAQENISDATVIFMCATCFPEELMDMLTQKLSKLKPGLKVITLKQLTNPEEHNFNLIQNYELPMTWSDSSPVYVYELR